MCLLGARTLLFSKVNFTNSDKFIRFLSTSFLRSCKLKIKDEHSLLDDKPIEYSKSNAAKWKAQLSRSGGIETGPWFQPYVVSISLIIFMLYFFVLREESDIDTEFEKNLYDRITGLEEKQLEIVLKYNLENNLPVNDIQNRLIEIQKVTENHK